jgi:epsilon-lactone hydrolase
MMGNPSYRMRMLTLLKQPSNEPLSKISKRYFNRSYPTPTPITNQLYCLCQVSEKTFFNQTVYTLKPKHNASTWHIIYTHGGAYVDQLDRFHWKIVTELIKATGATVTIPVYTLAPENHYMKAYNQLEQVYRSVLREFAAQHIILCGDSAGAGLALGQTLLYRELNLPLPGHIILFSPWLDVTISSPEARALTPKQSGLRADVLQEKGKWWAGSADPKTPLVSPLFGDFKGLPPMQVYIGSHDLFVFDARKLNKKVMACGGQIRYYETCGGFHGFMAVTFLPEAKEVFRRLTLNLVK